MMTEKHTEQMYLEDQIDAIQRVLTAPLPIVGDRRVALEKRIDLVLAVIAGTVHPGDVRVAPVGSIEDQMAGAFSALRGALA
jgi:hypothetical protein